MEIRSALFTPHKAEFFKGNHLNIVPKLALSWQGKSSWLVNAKWTQ